MQLRASSAGALRFLLAVTAIGGFSGQTAYGQAAGDMPTLAARVVETNPEIETQRGAVRVLEERVKSARAGFFPTVEANGLVQRRRLDVHGGATGDATFTAGEGNIEARLHLYDGLRTINSVQVAKEELDAGKATLDGTISSVLLQLLQSSADVRRDRQIRQYAQMQNASIAEQLAVTSRRLKFGEATPTQAVTVVRLGPTGREPCNAPDAPSAAWNRRRRCSQRVQLAAVSATATSNEAPASTPAAIAL